MPADPVGTAVLPPVAKGTAVAFNSPTHAWVLGVVDSHEPKSNTYVCSAREPEPVTAKVKNNLDEFFAPRAEYLEEDVNDLLTLTELHEASLLFCLKRRYMRDVVYTNIGPIVVALNPFTFAIPWYKDDKMEEYLSEGTVIERNLPHTWAVAHNTYWEMREDKRNQTILISGESGAGKTEGAKIVVKYVGILSTRHGTTEQQEACAVINRKVIAASPILESFGNAKTVRNDNSSRFGKFMKIQFDNDGFLIGSHATKYLLEKSRIITAGKDERVYHSFYQLAGGAENKKYGIRGAAVHKSMKSGDCVAIAGVDEGECFSEVKQAFTDVNISEEEQTDIWRICAGILFLQNVEFIEKMESSVKASGIDPDWVTALDRACDLWGIDRNSTERELLRQTHVQRGETVVKLYDRTKAFDTRDSVSKNLYSWLFDWLVERINVTTDSEARCRQWIGLLDIFGFEDFEVNSFEQLCINLANETLQNHYNFFIFTEDVRECKEEGIDTTHVTFADNMPCIDLLAAPKNSIFSMLDDECKVGSGSDAGFLNKIVSAFETTKTNAGHPFFVACTGKLKDKAFRVRHYAGDVTYQVSMFLEKNRDSLKDQIKEILMASKVALIPPLIPPIEDSSRPSTKLTVSAFFSRQLRDLMEVINRTNPHWIRCIKPHPAKKPRMFSHLTVTQQLRSAGVLATVKIRQGGYPIRFTKANFVRRYRVLATKEDGDWETKPDAVCKALFDRLEIDPSVGQLGRTKVFLRQRAYMELNHAKDSASQLVAAFLQRVGRAAQARHGLFELYCRKNKERLVAERKAREEALRREREEAERRRKAEEAERLRREQEERDRVMHATITCQKYARGTLVRIHFARHFLEIFRARDESTTDDRHAKFRLMSEKTANGLRQLENREAERRRHADGRDKHLRGGGDGAGGEEGDFDGVGGMPSRINEYEQMLRRREQLRVRREQHMTRVSTKTVERQAATAKKVKQMRDRAKAAEKEQRNVEEAAVARARQERRKAQQAKQEADEQRLAAVADRRAAAIAKLEQQRRDLEAAQMRVVMQEAADAEERETRARAAGSRGVATGGAAFVARTGRAGFSAGYGVESRASFNRQSVFHDVKNDWSQQQGWERAREAVLTQASARERRWLDGYKTRVEWQETAEAHSLAPRFPMACMSPTRDELYAERRPRAETTGAPTALTPKQLRMEAEFRRRHLALAQERDAIAQLAPGGSPAPSL